MRPLGRRGAVMAQVLVLAAFGALLCATLIQSRFQASVTANFVTQRNQRQMSGQAALNRLQQVWMVGGACASDAAAAIECVGTGCDCRCNLAGGVEVLAVPGDGACRLTVSVP